MTDDLNTVLELRRPGTVARRVRRRPICIWIANLLALLTFLLVQGLFSLEGEAAMGGILIFIFGILPLQAGVFVFLVVALLRQERPGWAYLSAVIPFLLSLLMFISSSLADDHSPAAATTKTLSDIYLTLSVITVVSVLFLIGKLIRWGLRRACIISSRNDTPRVVDWAEVLSALKVQGGAGRASLFRYIDNALREGQDESQITSALRKKGRSEGNIAEALGGYKNVIRDPAKMATLAEAESRARAQRRLISLRVLRIAGVIVLLLAPIVLVRSVEVRNAKVQAQIQAQVRARAQAKERAKERALALAKEEARAEAEAPIRAREQIQAQIVAGLAKNGVLIPAGEFLMGSPEGEGEPDEHPRHKVYLDAFYIDNHEVTVGQYKIFAKATGRQVIVQGTDMHPMANVSWEDAEAYCKWAGGRLPTEAEWEKAARGGTDTPYSFGDDMNKLDEYAWYESNSGKHAHPIGQKKPNQYGLYDMYGNVCEWVSDWYADSYYQNSPAKNPKGPSFGSLRSLRGGSAMLSPPICVRAAFRGSSTPDSVNRSCGFRCVFTAPQNSSFATSGGGLNEE
jgi:sulfatase modifying factor 1